MKEDYFYQNLEISGEEMKIKKGEVSGIFLDLAPLLTLELFDPS